MIPESSIITAIGHYLGCLERLKRLKFIRNNSGAMPLSYKGRQRFVRFGKEGSSDFIIFLPKGITIFIEAKSDTGKQSFEQIEFEGRITMLGYKYYLIRTFDEAKEIVDLYLKGK